MEGLKCPNCGANAMVFKSRRELKEEISLLERRSFALGSVELSIINNIIEFFLELLKWYKEEHNTKILVCTNCGYWEVID